MSSFYNTGLSGIKKLTRAQYDALSTKDANTKYIVTDSGSVCEYLGDTPIGGGGSGGVITGKPVAVSGGAMGTAALTGDVEEE